MQTFNEFLSACGVDNPGSLITFLENFSEDFNPLSLSASQRQTLENSMDKVFEGLGE